MQAPWVLLFGSQWVKFPVVNKGCCGWVTKVVVSNAAKDFCHGFWQFVGESRVPGQLHGDFAVFLAQF